MTYVSVIIPTRNRADYLRRALGAFQESPDGLEVIVVDDKSRIRDAEQNRDLCESLPGARLLVLVKPEGAAAARNHGLAASRAEYVWFVDDDDYVSRQTIHDVLASVRQDERRDHVILLPRDVVYGDVHLRRDVPVEEARKFERYRAFGAEVTTSCVLFPRKLLEELGGWDVTLRATEDTDLLLRASQLAPFRCLRTGAVVVDVGAAGRISTSLVRAQVGKVQFLRKHWRILAWRRKVHFILSVFLFGAILKGVRLRAWAALARLRRGGPRHGIRSARAPADHPARAAEPSGPEVAHRGP